ncbi:unnamed protein product [Schistocephalus solidus]|uniref:DUF4229 domain-containing protein n=1 Tax=Schistocephalus solidus TaxID=70667 RepID=A0A183TKH6_SCHSO|nr:unnamed protein product [Schistocephalus solidus]
MILFEGEPLLFTLFGFTVLGFLIGGCMWGAGQDNGERPRLLAGISVFFFGTSCGVCFILLFVYKRIKKSQMQKRDLEEMMRLQKEFAENEGFEDEEEKNDARIADEDRNY